ncbi:MAG: MBL fold metallo-hydrolase [Myxococcales bacterium]|nr:MBL fold metallo-hydrolase [Myxococcales bacterium]
MPPAIAQPELVQLEVGLLQNFCTLVCDPQSRLCALVDPAFEVDRILRTVRDAGLQPAAIWLTHTHFDHIEGVVPILQRLGPSLSVFVGSEEAEAVLGPCRAAGLAPQLGRLAGGETLRLGSLSAQVLATPGHTAAGRSYYLPELAAVITGDTLFVGSCGRPAAAKTIPTLWHSLMQLAELPEETRIYPGHDYGRTPTSRIGWERETNPYLRCADATAFATLLLQRIGRT